MRLCRCDVTATTTHGPSSKNDTWLAGGPHREEHSVTVIVSIANYCQQVRFTIKYLRNEKYCMTCELQQRGIFAEVLWVAMCLKCAIMTPLRNMAWCYVEEY